MAPLRPPVTAVVVALLGVGGLVIASTAGVALPAEVTDQDDPVDGIGNTTDGTDFTVDTGTETADSEGAADAVVEPSSATEAADVPADAVESADVDGTVETVEGTTASIDTALTGTASPIGGDKVDDLKQSLDMAAGELSPGGDGDDAVVTRPVGPTASTTPTPEPVNRTGPEAEAAGSDDTGAGPPLPPGAIALGGLLVGSVAVGRVLVLSTLTPGTGADALSATTRAVSEGFRPGWPDRFWRVAGLLRYGRYDDSDPLEHDTRAAIQEVIEERGGAYLSEISRATAVPLSTVRYHLGILEHENLVAPMKMRGKRLYFPAGSEPSALLAALKDDGAAAVLAALASHGPDSVSGLADRLGRDVSTVSHHLQQLSDAGLVRRERDGQAVENRLTPAVRDAISGNGDGMGPSIVPGVGGRQPSD